jgi:hypothetical protein
MLIASGEHHLISPEIADEMRDQKTLAIGLFSLSSLSPLSLLGVCRKEGMSDARKMKPKNFRSKFFSKR